MKYIIVTQQQGLERKQPKYDVRGESDNNPTTKTVDSDHHF